MKKSSGAGKIILIILLVALVVAIAAILMPVALIGGVGAIWYFTKMKPDIKKRNISIAVAVVGLLGTIFITPAVFKDNNNSTTTSSTTVTTSSSSSKTKESSSSSSSKAETTTENSSKTEESTEPTTQNDGPEYTEESNAAFATAFMNTLNQSLAGGGVNVSMSVQYMGKNLIYVIVPQDFKYEPTSSIQKLADTVYQAKENYFNEWAIDNGYDLSYTNAPHLYIKSDGDQTTLAEESGIFNKTMKVKVKN